MSENLPITCALSDAELRSREASLLPQFRAKATVSEELDDGYAFYLPGDQSCLELVLKLMTAERECCPFLTFDLHAAPQQGPLSLHISGPAGTKEFLKSLLRLS